MQDGQTAVNLRHQPHDSHPLHFPKGPTGIGEIKLEDELILNAGLGRDTSAALK